MIRELLVRCFGALLVGVAIAGIIVTLTAPEFTSRITGSAITDLPVFEPNERSEPLWQAIERTRNQTNATNRSTTPVAPVDDEPEPAPTRSGGGGGGGGSSRSSDDDRELVTLTVSATNVTGLAGVQFTIRYESGETELRTIREGDFLDDGDTAAAMLTDDAHADGAGRDVIIFRTAGGGVSGSGVLMTATFMSETSGSDITISGVILADENAEPLATDALTWSVD